MVKEHKKRIVSLLFVLTLLGSSIFGGYAMAASGDAVVNVTSVEYNTLNEKEKAELKEVKPDFVVEHEKTDVKLVYKDEEVTTKEVTTSTKETGPKTGINTSDLILYVIAAGASIAVIAILIKKPKHSKHLLVLVGAVGVSSLLLAGGMQVHAKGSLPQGDSSIVSIGDSFKHDPIKVDGYKYVGYILITDDTKEPPVEDTSKITVRFVDENEAIISDDVELNGIVGKSYAIQKKTIPGFTFAKVTGSLNGLFTKDRQVVTLHYKRNQVIIEEGSISVKYIDTLGNTIKDDLVTKAPIGTKYEVEHIAIDGYIFKSQTGSVSEYTKDNQEITLIYEKNIVLEGKVLVKWVDEDGNELMSHSILVGPIGAKFNISPSIIEGYTFKEKIGDATEFQVEQQTIIFVYLKDAVQDGRVVVKYQDESGTELKPDSLISGPIGAEFNVVPIEIEGYTYKGTSGDVVEFKAEEQIVILVYTQNVIQNGSITIKYVDTDANTIKDDLVTTAPIGTAYTVDHLAIDGYSFKSQTGDATAYTQAPQIVTLVYEKNDIVYDRLVINFKAGETNEDVSLPNLNEYNNTPINFDNYYLRVVNPVTGTISKYKYGEIVGPLTIEQQGVDASILPKEIYLDTYYSDEQGVEHESYGPTSIRSNGYTGDRYIGVVGYSDFKATLLESSIVYDQETKTITVTYKSTFTLSSGGY